MQQITPDFTFPAHDATSPNDFVLVEIASVQLEALRLYSGLIERPGRFASNGVHLVFSAIAQSGGNIRAAPCTASW
jgi:hypothetical protein